MKLKAALFYILFSLFFTGSSKAQLISKALTYGDTGLQRTAAVYIDHTDNRYQIMEYDSILKIKDGNDTIRIKDTQFASALVKFDSDGRYLFHRFITPVFIPHSLAFSDNNEVYLFFKIGQRYTTVDTLRLYDKNGEVYSKISIDPDVRGTGNLSQYHRSTLLCKLDKKGNFKWVRYLWRQTLPRGIVGSIANINRTDISVDRDGNIRCFFMNYRPKGYGQLLDTINVSDAHSTIIDRAEVKADDIIVTFSPNGKLIKTYTPFEKLNIYTLPDTSYYKYYQTVTDGNYHYSIIRVNIHENDTLDTPHKNIPLSPGANYLLLKTNNKDSLYWAKLLIHRNGVDKQTLLSLALDTTRQQLILAQAYRKNHFKNAINPLFSMNSKGTYVCLLDTGGNLVKERGVQGLSVQSLTFNPISNEYLMSARSDPSLIDPVFGDYFPSHFNGQGLIHFVASIDTNLNVTYARTIHPQTFDGRNYRFGGYYYFFDNAPTTDSKGRTYIPGAFADSLTLPCSTYYAHDERGPGPFNTPMYDAFVLILNPLFPTDTQACTQYTGPSGKYSWNQSGRYYDTLQNTEGCDSIVVINLEILTDSVHIDTSVCSSLQSPSGKYFWDSSGTYIDTLVNEHGCDSILSFKVEVLQNKIEKDTAVCIAMESPGGKHLWDSSGTYTDTFTNRYGCDSIITFNLKVLQSDSTLDTSACTHLTSPSGKHSWDSSGVYKDTLTNVFGCDSILTFNLAILEKDTAIDTAVCTAMQSPWGKYLWDTTGIYSDTLVSKWGCDSVITFNLTVLQNKTQTDTAVCRSLISPSEKYNWKKPGTYRDTVPNQYGCDSVLIITLDILQSYDSFSVTECHHYTSPGGKYLWDTSGIYRDTIINNAGCDSILTINLSIQQLPGYLDTTVCNVLVSPSGKYTWNSTGTYNDTLADPNGCDSFITINLSLSDFEIGVFKSNDISCDTAQAQLEVNGGRSFIWNPENGLSDASIFNPIAQPEQTTLYTVTATDNRECKATDSITVYVDKTPKLDALPNVFTPGDDGYNDCFSLVPEKDFEQVNFFIFSRWGEIVFSATDANACWNGTLNNTGFKVPDGVYFYDFTGSYCGEKMHFSGSVSLLR